MGSGYKDFTAGAVLTADEVDGYLMRQSVMSFATTTARDTALSGVLAEGMVAWIQDEDTLYHYDGSSWNLWEIPIDSGWIAVSGGVGFTNSWANAGGGEQDAEYRKIGNQVFIRGRITTGSTDTAAFTLPTGYRPPATVRVHSAGGSTEYTAVSTAGVVTPFNTGGGSHDMVFSFFVD